MDVKKSVKDRRKARIQELLEEMKPEELADIHNMHRQAPASERIKSLENANTPRANMSSRQLGISDSTREEEPDPEKMWKENRNHWYGMNDTPTPPASRPSFAASFIRKLSVSMVLFGAVWGLFSIEEPWAFKARGFIVEGLSREMDFQAAQTWYDEHFEGAPSFIPIFGQTEDNSTKVNSLVMRGLSSPVNGVLTQSFAVDLKGIRLVPVENTRYSREVKSIETGRVLEIRQLEDQTLSVTIQHTGNRTAVYSGLSATAMKVNSWVESGDVVGMLPAASAGEEPGALYFVLKEGDRAVDPAGVISFD